VPQGTAIPTYEFEFTATPSSLDGNPVSATDSRFPALNAAALKISLSADDYVQADPDRHSTTVTKQGTNLVAGLVRNNFGGAGAGVYAYTLKEKATDYTPVTGYKLAKHDSGATYTVEVYVTATEIVYVLVYGETGDDGFDLVPKHQKVEAKPETETGKFSGVVFTNVYAESAIIDPDDPIETAPLLVSKAVKNDSNQSWDNALEFPFTATIAIPELTVPPELLAGLATEYTAQVYEADGTTEVGSEITFKNKEANTFNLKATQQLVFTSEIPVGSTWTVSETLNGDSDYSAFTPIVNVRVGDPVASTKLGPGTKGATFGTGVLYIGKSVLGRTGTANSAAYINSLDTEAPPAGIIINNLPYIGLIALAFAGLAAYVAARARRRGFGEYTQA
jgi:hypothetical protein